MLLMFSEFDDRNKAATEPLLQYEWLDVFHLILF